MGKGGGVSDNCWRVSQEIAWSDMNVVKSMLLIKDVYCALNAYHASVSGLGFFQVHDVVDLCFIQMYMYNVPVYRCAAYRTPAVRGDSVLYL